MAKNILKIIAIFIIGMVGGVFADQIFWPYFVERPLFYQYRLEKTPIYVTERKEVFIQENTALRGAIEKVKNSTIYLQSQTVSGKVLEGSGLILTSDGLVVTLAELVPRGSKFSFYVEGKKTPFQILKRDLKENLALIKLEKESLPTVDFADLEKTKLGERVFLVAKLLKEKEIETTTNEGIIKRFDQDIIETNIFEDKKIKGAPLFNIDGKALGLITVDSQGRVSAIPISKIKSFSGF